MKILHLTDERWDSGLTSYALQLAALQKRAGDAVMVGARPGKRPEALAQDAGLTTRPVETFWDLVRLVRAERWDIINAHTGSSHSKAVIATLLGTVIGKPPTEAPRAVVRTRGDARPLGRRPFSRFLYRRTGAIIAASDHIREQYTLAFGFRPERVTTIYPGIAPDAAWSPPNGKTVGLLGRLDVVKGHATFLEAAVAVRQKHPDARFLIAGAEAGVTVDLLRNQARALGIEGAVSFLGRVPSARDFMRGCAVGVIASIGSEEISRACLEWMSVGRPVIGTLVGCLPELIEPEETGALVAPDDSVALAESVDRVLADPALAKRWGTNALAVVAKRFSPDVFLSSTRDAYARAIRHG